MMNFVVNFASVLCMLAWLVCLAVVLAFAVILAGDLGRMLAHAFRTLWHAAGRHGRNAYAGGTPHR